MGGLTSTGDQEAVNDAVGETMDEVIDRVGAVDVDRGYGVRERKEPRDIVLEELHRAPNSARCEHWKQIAAFTFPDDECALA
eukprot:3933409-Rhodomonas_salina.4